MYTDHEGPFWCLQVSDPSYRQTAMAFAQQHYQLQDMEQGDMQQKEQEEREDDEALMSLPDIPEAEEVMQKSPPSLHASAQTPGQVNPGHKYVRSFLRSPSWGFNPHTSIVPGPYIYGNYLCVISCRLTYGRQMECFWSWIYLPIYACGRHPLSGPSTPRRRQTVSGAWIW